MSNRDKNMFRQEQRFSFRKYSFGLASALIANVVFGATIAGGPIVHANTETDAATVTSSSGIDAETVGSTDVSTITTTETVAAPVERLVSLTYTVKVVDKAGTVLKTEEKTVDVTAGEGLAFIIAELGEELVPADYKLVDGLGQVRVVENQENVFTVTVEKEEAEQASEATNTEALVTANSEAAEVVASETAVAPAPVKVVETAPTSASGLSSLALLAYEVRYTDSEGEVVHKTAGLVTAESKDGVATKEVSFTANDLPEGYELAEGQSASLTKQLVENQINILSFAVVKKSKEEEVAESQLANKDVLEQVTSEADLLADEALRQVATTQAGNTALEIAAVETKKVATEAQAVLKDASATQETVDAQVETVKASTQALADEMLKVDADGVLTAQLSERVVDSTSYQVANNPTTLANVDNKVYITERTVTGQHVKIVVEYNGRNQTTHQRPYLDFALPKDVVDSSVRVALQHKADAGSAWINQWQEMAGYNINDYRTGQRDLAKLASTTNARLLYDYSVTNPTAGVPGLRAKFGADDYFNGTVVKNDALAGKFKYYFENQMGNTSEIFRYVIEYDVAPGVNPNDTPFFAKIANGGSNADAFGIYESKIVDAPANQPATGTNPQSIYVFNNTPIKTVAPNTDTPDNRDRVSVGTVADADGIRSIAVSGGGTLGYTINNNAEAIGTPSGAPGFYSRSLTVTDNTGATTTVFPNSASTGDQRYTTYILDTTTNTPTTRIALTEGQTLESRAADIIHAVGVRSDNGHDVVEAANDKKYRKIIAPGQSLSATGGDQTIMVRIITDSNVYKDVPVYITAPPAAKKTDQYNITWDNASVAGRTDAGFSWATDASGKRVLVYKYDLDNHTAFTMDDVLKQLNATPNAANSSLRTLDGPEKALIENNDETDRYTMVNNTAKLNGQTIDFLDIVNPNPLWGGRKVVSSDPGTNANYNTFYVPGTTDIGTASNQITIGNTNGVGSITLTDSAHNMYSNQIDRQKLYIRSTPANVETGSGSAVATDTDTDTIPVYMVGYKRNNPPVVTTSATNTNVTVQEGTPKAIHVFSKTVGDTEDASGNKLFTPDANKNLANPLVPIRKLAEFSDPDAGDTVTYKYNDLRNDQPNLSQTNLVMTNDGYLSGDYTDWGPGAKATRRIDVTDNHGAMTSSDPFLVLGYTVKADNTTPLAVTGRPTLDQIKTKLVTDVNSAYPNAVPSTMVVPTDQYAHAIVGYRTAAGQPTQTGELPASGNYQVKVRTTNIYGQELFNWVDVNSTPANTPATAQNPQPLYLFNNTPIATVGAGTDAADNVNKVKIATLADPEGIQSVAIGQGDSLGYTVDNQGNAEGTPSVTDLGSYKRALTVTDNQNNTTTVLENNGNNDQRFTTYIMDASSAGTITKTVGQTVTAQEILDNVTINPGNADSVINDTTDPKFRKVLAPGQTVPTTPGTHTVTVRVITDSNVYKDVPVTVVIPENPPSTATNKQDIYVFKNSPIQTVNPATNEPNNTNKVKIADLADPQGIKQVEVKQIGSSLGYTVDTDGNATGTVADVGVGPYSRELSVTDNLDAQTTVLVNGSPDQRFKTYVMDVTTDTTPVEFALGDTLESRTADILNKVSISSGAANAHIEGTVDNNPKYTKVLAPGETLPTTPGNHTVTVRVITDSNVYKDVEVPITIPANTAPTVRQDIPNQYVWKGTSLSPAVDADVNDVNSTATRDDIQRVYFSYVENTNDAGNPGAVSINKDSNNNYLISGTPVGGAGESWTRRVTAQDKQNATGQSNPFTINILDSRVVSEITKPENSPVTADEVLAKVEVLSRSVSGSTTHDVTTRLNNDGGVTKRILTDLAALPKTGRQTVQVELTTPSGQTKIEEVIVNFTPPATNDLTPAYAENTVAPGASATTPPTFTNANGQTATAPTGATYAIPASFTPPTGYTATINPTTGAVTLTAPNGATVETVEVPVSVTYADGSTDTTSAVFKLDTDGDGTPNVTDTDDDNDGIPDARDAQPKTPTTSAVTVNDATVVAGQPITAIPVSVTTDDTQATVAVTGLPAGLTYNPTTKQIEGTPTGAEIPEGQDSVPVTVTATVTDAKGTPVTDTAVITIQRDTDKDGIPDVTDPDIDGDGIPNTEEQTNGTDPKNPDTDGDGITDGAEKTNGTDPKNPDT
ncbi:TPA: YPDG domain-containing protein, partial [Streptococcus suis]